MKLRWKILLIVGALALAALASFIAHKRLLSYQGRSLRTWVEDYSKVIYSTEYVDPQKPQPSAEALRHIGTNAIPQLLRWAHYPGCPSWKGQALDRLENFVNAFGFDWNSSDWRLEGENLAEASVWALALLSPKSKQVVPELARLSTESKLGPVKYDAALALAKIGGDAIPYLFAALTNQDAAVRCLAAHNLHYLGTNAQPAHQQLIRMLLDPDPGVAKAAARTLGNSKTAPSTVIPILQAQLTNGEPSRRAVGTTGLKGYGTLAAVAAPALSNALTDPDLLVRSEASSALHQVDPQAFTNQRTAKVISLFASPDVHRRQAVVSALGTREYDIELAKAALIKALSDQDALVRQEATNALRKIAPEALANNPAAK